MGSITYLTGKALLNILDGAVSKPMMAVSGAICLAYVTAYGAKFCEAAIKGLKGDEQYAKRYENYGGSYVEVVRD